MDARLRRIASFVRPGSRLADIGADHAYLCIELVGSGVCPSAVATDIRQGPAACAAGHISAAGLADKIAVRLGDGLSPLRPDEADDIVVAGMGGETIAAILDAAPWTRDDRYRLILQPMSRPEALRGWLLNNGYAIAREEAAGGKRVYTVLGVRYDPAEAARMRRRPAAEYVGALDPADPRARRYLQEVQHRLLCAAAGLDTAGRAAEAAERIDAVDNIKQVFAV